MSNNDLYYSDTKLQLMIKQNTQKRNQLQKQLLEGRKLLSATENPGDFQTANELEMMIDVLKQSLNNTDEAKSMIGITEQAIHSLIAILQTILEVTVQARQPGISQNNLTTFVNTIKSLQEEFKSTLKLITYRKQPVFYHKDRLVETDQKTWEVEKRFRWNVSDNLLTPIYLTFMKPKVILEGLMRNFFYKVLVTDSKTYNVDSLTVSTTLTGTQLDYNIKVIQNDIHKLETYIGDLATFNNTVTLKRKTLLSVYSHNLELLQETIGIDRDVHAAKIEMLNCQIKTAKQAMATLCDENPITNTVSNILNTSTSTIKML